MADTNTINSLAADPDFLKLSEEEQKHILNRATGKLPQPKNAIPLGVSMMGSTNPQTKLPDAAVDVARPFIAGAVGHTVGALAAPSGPVAVGADLATYTGVDTLLKYLKQNPPSSLGESLAESGGEAVGNKVIGGLMNFLGRGVKAVRNADQTEIQNFLPTTSQAAKAAGQDKLAIATKALEDISLTAKEKALDRSAGAGFTQALKLAKNNDFNFSRNPQLMKDMIQQDSPSITNYTPFRKGQPFQLTNESVLDSFSKIDKVIGDPAKLQDVLTTAQANGVGENLKKSLQGYQFMKIFQNATKQSLTEGAPGSQNIVRINSQSLADDWLDPKMQDSLKTLYNSKQRADIGQFFKNVAMTQDKINANPVAKKIWMLHGGVGIATGLLTGSLEGGTIASVGTFIGAETLGRLLTNPKVGRLLVAMAGGESLGVSEAYAGRQIANALQGSTIALIGQDGSKTPVKVQGEKLVPLGQ